MGNRTAIGFRRRHSDTNTVYLYIHWDDYAGVKPEFSPLVSQIVNHTRPRWDDYIYATRMAISHAIGDQYNSEFGYGITANHYPDIDYPSIAIISFEDQCITRVEANPTQETPEVVVWRINFMHVQYGNLDPHREQS